MTATVTVAPRKAQAQTCETMMELIAHQGLMVALQEAAMQALNTLISNTVNSLINSALGAFGISGGGTDGGMNCYTSGTDCGELDDLDQQNRQAWADLWAEWLPGMHDMTKQLNTADLDKSRMWGEFLNAALQTNTQRELQGREIDAMKRYRPSEEICVADTINPLQLNAQISAGATKAAMESELYESGLGLGGMSMGGTLAAQGPNAVLNAEFQEYMNNYYDPNFNGGLMPPGAPSPRARDQYNIAKTIFGADTIDLNDQNRRQDVQVAQRLLVGSPVLPNIDQEAFNTAQGRQQVLQRRQYQTRLNTFAGAVGDVVGERSSGAATPEVAAMQVANGRPLEERAPGTRVSYQEIKSTRLQHMWTPRYITELDDSPNTAIQKQIDIYTQQTVELQDMMRKMERMGLTTSARLGMNLDSVARPDTSQR
ncbi:MAG: hypothetical protein EP349_10125 [Alphaproteobacteria bacterium]|nr:MAG: hypothetical protein EP349_10125 [Alphaproteobacteria bacterium]